MDNFKAIYKMLSALERAMDLPAFSVESFGLDSMQVSGERLYRYLEMLQDAGLIKGAELYTDVTGEMHLRLSLIHIYDCRNGHGRRRRNV